ncbi:MAG: RNA ligase family protein [Bacteroidales bacterium]|nr:RNA ligase family protein [Bacteroidales bacterium]
MKYPKINTLWKRDEKTHKIVDGDFSRPEFENIKGWHVTEKIDGANIRVKCENSVVKFDGRTDEAQIPTHLYEALSKMFTLAEFETVFSDTAPKKVILYGEGYGARIQKGGGAYRSDAGFILFDVWVDGWWLQRDAVEDIAKKFGIDTVPLLGIMTYDQIVDYVKANPESLVAKDTKIMEGVVARSHPLVLFRDGTPVMFKLKVRDFL